MKAAVVEGAGIKPVYKDFADPVAADGLQLLPVKAAALTHLTKGRASGSHYSSDGEFPMIPGVDGVGVAKDGRRLYFALPESPFGAMAETTIVESSHCIEVPAGLDDITAAALANPGMSAWAALVERAQMRPGETVLVNGATGSAGRLAVQIAHRLGAAKVIVTGRNAAALEEMRALGADILIPFSLDEPGGSGAFEDALMTEFASGIGVVVDYLWGASAATILMAMAKAVESTTPVRFIQVGSASADEISLKGAALRSSPVVLMGSGLKSVPFGKLLEGIKSVFLMAAEEGLHIAARPIPLAQVEAFWDKDSSKERLVFVP